MTRTLSVSFARGEISPNLHARVDLAFYNIALAKLKNMIVLPQGVLTRRPGFVTLGNALKTGGDACPARLIPFVYNREDAMVIELAGGQARVWRPRDGQALVSFASPYAEADLDDVKYIQNGNVLFLTHRDYPIKLLRRNSLTDWTFSDLEFKRGPWLDDSGGGDITMMAVKSGSSYYVDASSAYFTADMAGRLLRLKHTVEGSGYNQDSGDHISDGGGAQWSTGPSLEVGGQWQLQASGEWAGIVQAQKSLDGGENWMTVKEHTSERVHDNDLDTDYYDGNIDWTGAETETNVIYRVRTRWTFGAAIKYRFTVLGYVKANYFKITSIVSPTRVYCSPRAEPYEYGSPIADRWTRLWDLGAWGGASGYPGCAAFYQERLVLAGSKGQPQTVWFSRTGQYDDFGETDPITDDAPITITIAGGGLDGIHSLLAMTDILAFTSTGEWRISGAGENGALSPLAVVPHKQSNVGSCPIQPVIVDSAAVMVQTMRAEVYAEQYSFELDGYMGSNISILSGHLFDRSETPADRRVRRMAYQQIPDSLVWCVLEDGTAVTCTLRAEHEMTAWARQETDGVIGDVCCVPGETHTELWAAVRRAEGGAGVWKIERLAPRAAEDVFLDAGNLPYESLIETLRINMESGNGSLMAGKKFIPRVTVFALRSGSVRVAPKSDRERARDRALDFGDDGGGETLEAEVVLDNGFEKNAGIRIWTDTDEPLTILAISPTVAVGG